MKVCLINKYYLPDTGVTAMAAYDLVHFLEKQDYTVRIISCSSTYRTQGKEQKTKPNNLKIKSFYNGKIKLLRLLGACVDSFRLTRRAARTDSDIYIVMTSPPLLNFFAARFFKRKKKRWVYWSLDLYPEAFAANQLVSKNNFIYKYILRKSYNYTPSYLLALGEQQSRYLRSQFNSDIPYAVLPCGRFLSNEHNSEFKPKANNEKGDGCIHFAYIGNLGEAHSEKFLKILVERLIPGKHKLSLSVYGTKSESIKSWVASSPCVIIRDYIPEKELSKFDIHLASLLPEWKNICVPSKLVSAVSNKASFLFCGPKDSDSWMYLQEAGWLINIESDMNAQIKNFLDSLNKVLIQNKRDKAKALSDTIRQDVEKAYEKFKGFADKETEFI